MDRKRAIHAAISTAVTVVINVHLGQELTKVCAQPALNFWRVIYGNLLDTAALEWCKLFGSHDVEKQPIHWKSISQDPEQFKKQLLSALAVSAVEWDSNWSKIKKYRDRAVAHFDPRQVHITHYPDFELALPSTYFYYKYLREELASLGEAVLPEDLEQYSKAFAKKAAEVANAALEATKFINETAY